MPDPASDPSSRRLLVTGAGGFVGAAVCRAAARAGHSVVGTIRPGGNGARLNAEDASLEIAEVDLRDTQGVASLLRAQRPDTVIHTAWAGVSNAARMDRTQITDNIEASIALMDAAIECGASRFVGIGSQGEYGLMEGRISESSLPAPTSLYGAAKLAVCHLSQQLAAQGGVTFAWLRLFSTYGPGDNPNWLIPSMIETMLDGRTPKTTEGKQRWDWLYIDDVAGGTLATALQPDASGIFNLGSGRPVQVRGVIERIRDLVAPDMDLVFGEIPYRPDQVWHMEADMTRLAAATGWSPAVEIDAGLKATVDWHRARRPMMELAR